MTISSLCYLKPIYQHLHLMQSLLYVFSILRLKQTNSWIRSMFWKDITLCIRKTIQLMGALFIYRVKFSQPNNVLCSSSLMPQKFNKSSTKRSLSLKKKLPKKHSKQRNNNLKKSKRHKKKRSELICFYLYFYFYSISYHFYSSCIPFYELSIICLFFYSPSPLI